MPPKKTYEEPIEIEHLGGARRVVWFLGWAAADKPKSRERCLFTLRGMNGVGEFSIATGKGYGELKDWQVTEESQDKLIEWANVNGRLIRRRRAKRPKPRSQKVRVDDPAQIGFGFSTGGK